MKKLLLTIFLFLVTATAFSQPYYYKSGDPTSLANWGNQPGGEGTHPFNFFQSAEYIIEGGKNPVVDFFWLFGASGASLKVRPGATLTANAPISIVSGTIFALDSAGTYIHNNTFAPGTSIYQGSEEFHPKSKVRIDNWVNTSTNVINSLSQNVMGYYYGSLEINWQGCSSDWFQNLPSIVLCMSELKISSTGKGILAFGTNGSNAAIAVLVGSYVQNDGEVDLSLGSTLVGGYATSLRILEKFEKTGGILDANGGGSFGEVLFFRGVFYPDDTTRQTFSNSGTTRRIRFTLGNYTKMRLIGNMALSTNNPSCGFYADYGSIFEPANYQVTGIGPFTLGDNVTLKISNQFGFKSGASTGSIITTGAKTFGFNDTIDYNGTLPQQVIGDSLPNQTIPYLRISNPNDVNLNRTLKLNMVEFKNGILNLGNYDLILPSNFELPTSAYSATKYFRTNGTGYVKSWITASGGYEFYVGNQTYNPVVLGIASLTPDTFAIRVTDGFIPGAMPNDTSFLVKKTWHIVEKTPGNTSASVGLYWFPGQAGSNFIYPSASNSYIGAYNNSTSTYTPTRSGNSGSFPPGLNNMQFMTCPIISSFNETSYFIAGNKEGVYNSYYYISGDANLLSNWKKNQDGSGLSPAAFDGGNIFAVTQNKNAVFNSPVTFSSQTLFQARGNGIITANQPITNLGFLELSDSATYTHNNTGIAASTIFAGDEEFNPRSTYNITMWSDTSHKLADGINYNIDIFGNLTINFNNLTNISNGKWQLHTNFRFIRGTLKYIRSSGFQLGLVTNSTSENFFSLLNLQLGDSVNYPNESPVLNLSAGTIRGVNASSMLLDISGNLDIQRGGLISQDNVARGRLRFIGGKKHTFYCYNPFLWQTYYLGSSNFPNQISNNDTLVLKSDFYRSQNIPFLFTDVWEVFDGGVLDLDTFSIRSISLRVTRFSKVITRKKEGFMADLTNVQNIDFQSNSILEFAGSQPQNFFQPGSREIKNIPSLRINNPNNVTMNVDSVTIHDTIYMQSGKLIVPSSNYMTIVDSARFKILNSNSYIDGPVKIITSSMTEKIIPLGKGSNSRSLKILPTSNLYTEWLTEYFNTQQTFGSALDPSLMGISSNEYFTIDRAGSSSAFISLPWGSTSGVINPANVRVAKWNGSMWVNFGATSYTGTNESGSVYSGLVDSFSPFVIASTDAQPLPVELASFTSMSVRNEVILDWATASEINNSGFDIERKLISDTIWNKIGFVQGSGNSNSVKNYKYEDRNLASGKYNYRLKQIDYNGNFNYFNLQNEINVGIPNEFALSQNYPNPFNPATKINFEIPKDAQVSLQIFDMAGRLVTSLINNANYTAGYYTVQFNASQLSSGTYFYRLVTGEFVQTKKMQLIK